MNTSSDPLPSLSPTDTAPLTTLNLAPVITPTITSAAIGPAPTTSSNDLQAATPNTSSVSPSQPLSVKPAPVTTRLLNSTKSTTKTTAKTKAPTIIKR